MKSNVNQFHEKNALTENFRKENPSNRKLVLRFHEFFGYFKNTLYLTYLWIHKQDTCHRGSKTF